MDLCQGIQASVFVCSGPHAKELFSKLQDLEWGVEEVLECKHLSPD